jgi:hypothetical protein
MLVIDGNILLMLKMKLIRIPSIWVVGGLCVGISSSLLVWICVVGLCALQCYKRAA